MASLKDFVKKHPLLYRSGIRFRDQMAYASWLLKKPRVDAGRLERVNLHLGCGEIDYPGFINIDARPGPHVHFVRQVENLGVFKSDFADLIYVSHCLEHISHRKVPQTLAEWYRVLKPGGTLRLSVPDFDLLLQIYQENNRDMESILLPLLGGQDYAQNVHFSCFNAGFLQKLLEQAGFRQINKWVPGTEPYTSLPDWSGRSVEFRGMKYPVSLNMEGIK